MTNTNNTALCFLYNKKYQHQGDIALNSAKKHNPNYTTIHLTDDTPSSIADKAIHPSELGLDHNDDNWMTIGRVSILEYTIKILKYNSAIFIDGDTFTYHNYSDFQIELDKNYSLIVIPHITKPLPEDNLYPQNRTICLAGNYNSGFLGVTQKSLPFLEWWKYQTSLYPKPVPEAGLAGEQGWLRFAGDFIDDIKIFKHPGYNVAYWNIKQRMLELQKNKIYIDNQPLCVMHFSGLKKEVKPEFMSIFQNRYVLEQNDIAYNIFSNYHNLVWNS